jgi:hypothetical protein
MGLTAPDGWLTLQSYEVDFAVTRMPALSVSNNRAFKIKVNFG